MDPLGGHGAYALVLAVGLVGSALYATLRRSRAFSTSAPVPVVSESAADRGTATVVPAGQSPPDP